MNDIRTGKRFFLPFLICVCLALHVPLTHAGIETAVDTILDRESSVAPQVLNLKDCMHLAMTQNKEVLAALHAIRETELGTRLVTRSRLYPQIELVWNYAKDHYAGLEPTPASSATDDSVVLQFSQRLFEFGKDPAVEVQLRAAERAALYDFENTVRKTLSAVRKKFYTILLRREQLEIRQELLAGFRDDYEKKSKRLEQKEATIEPFDVLQAELNVLFEERNLNNLQRTIAVEEYALLKLMGEPIGAKVSLLGAQDETVFDVDLAVRTALDNSTQLALGREEIEEQRRVVREVMWEYFPDVSLAAGYRRDDDEAGVTVSNNGDDTWAVDLGGDIWINSPDDREQLYSEYEPGDADYYVDLQVSVPVFEGFRRVGVYNRERERLRQAELLLADQQEEIERLARQRFADMVQSARNVRVAERQAAISRRQLRIQERLQQEIPAMVTDDQFEIFRNRFFRDQDDFFGAQIDFVSARENLREVMGYFEDGRPDDMADPGDGT